MTEGKRLPVGLIVLTTAALLVAAHLLAVGLPSNNGWMQSNEQVEQHEYAPPSVKSLQASSLSMNEEHPKNRFQTETKEKVRSLEHRIEEDAKEVDLEEEKKSAEDDLLLLGHHKVTHRNEGNLAYLYLVISSPGRVVIYNVDKGQYSVLHEGQGSYYGLLPGENPEEIWVSQSITVGAIPDSVSKISLVKDESKFTTLPTKSISSFYMHDTVATPDKRSVLVADVSGTVLMYTFPAFEEFKRFPVFTKREHINTLAPTNHGTTWVVLHNAGPSMVVEIDLGTGSRLCTIKNVGDQAHGMVFIENGEAAILLSSRDARLIKLQMPRNCFEEGGEVIAQVKTIWKSQNSVGEPKFLKGLAVVDGIAYFGMSDFKSSRAARKTVVSSLVAVDLSTGKQLWVRSNIGTIGIMNVIGAPMVTPESSYREMSRNDIVSVTKKLELWKKRTFTDASISIPISAKQNRIRFIVDDLSMETSLIEEKEDGTEEFSELPKKEGKDPDCVAKLGKELMIAKASGYAYGLTKREEAFIRLPLKFDVKKLQEEAHILEDAYGFTFRPDVNNYFILLVTRNGEIEQSRIGPFIEVPDRLTKTPYMRKAMDSLGAVVGRSRFMMLKAGESVKIHHDDVDFERRARVFKAKPRPPAAYSNGYWARRFRVHIPLVSHELVSFGSGASTINMKEGFAYLFDNGNSHWVKNESPIDRVHLILDTVGSPRLFELMRRATMSLKSGEIIQGDPEEEIPSIPGEDQKFEILTENWAGAAAFSFMHTSDFKPYVEKSIIARIVDEDFKNMFRDIWHKFLSGYEESCLVSPPDLDRCEELATDLLELLQREFTCSKSGPAKLKRTSLSVYDAMEPLIRQLFFPCEKDSLKWSEKDAVPLEEVKPPYPTFPLKSHPYRIPPCQRSKRRPPPKSQET